MKKKFNWKTGIESYHPENLDDKGLLAHAEEAIFNATTFPSGWVSPSENWTAKAGILIKV